MRADGTAQESLAADVVARCLAFQRSASQEPRAAVKDLRVGRRMSELVGPEVDRLMIFASQDVVDKMGGSAMGGRSEAVLHTSDLWAGHR